MHKQVFRQKSNYLKYLFVRLPIIYLLTKIMHKYTKEDDSDSSSQNEDDLDPFKDDDLSWDVQITDKFGKRTGKLYQPQKWKKNSDGFYDFQIESNETFTPQSKINIIRQLIGLQKSKNNQPQKLQIQTNDNKLSKFKKQNHSSPNNEKRIIKETDKQKIKRRKTDLSLSFSLQLNQASQYQIQQTDTSSLEDDVKQEKEQTKQKKKQSLINQKTKIQVDKQISQPKLQRSSDIRQNQPTQTQIPKQKHSSKQVLKQSNQTYQNINIQNNGIKLNQNILNESIQSSKILKKQFIIDQKQKLQTYKHQIFQPNVSLGEMPSNFQQRSSFKKYFKDFSEIKRFYDKDESLNSNQSLESLISVIQNKQSYSETGELNRAITNVKSGNTDKDSNQKYQQEQKLKGMQKNKQKIGKNKKTVNKQLEDNNQRHKHDEDQMQFNRNSQGQRQSAHSQSLLAKVDLKDQRKQSYFLTESLRKQAAFYYEEEEKEARQAKEKQAKLSKQAQIKKNSKRERNFQNVQTNDILNYQKLDQLKDKGQHQKASKKLKVNEPIKLQKTQQTNQNKSEKPIFPKIQSDQKSKVQHQNSFHEQKRDEWDQFSESIEQEKKIKINNKLVKQADKHLKRKEKPERTTPIKKGVNKKHEILDSQSRDRSLKSKPLSKAKSLVNDKNIYIPNQSQMITNSQVRHKYPKRNRYERLQFWNGEKIVYDAEGNAKNVETKQLFKLIGFMAETLEGELQLQPTLSKGNQYIQQVTLKSRQTIDFMGFDEKYLELHIEIRKKNKISTQKLKKYVQVFRDGELNNLIEPLIIEPNSGHFSLQNISKDNICLQFVLIKNPSPHM